MKVILQVFIFIFTISITYAQNLTFYPQPINIPDSLYWKTEDGQYTSISDFKGQVILLNFWATWCTPCVKELPSFDALQKKYGNAGFKVIAITGDDPAFKVEQFYKRYGIKNLEIYTESSKKLQKTLNVKNLPSTFLINHQGQAISFKEGFANWLSDDIKQSIEHELRKIDTPTQLPEQSIIEHDLNFGVRQ